MRYFVVRHKLTQQMLVLTTGASWWEPATDPRVNHAKVVPRLFKNHKSAKAFIASWLRGRSVLKLSDDGVFLHSVEPVPSRSRLDLEVAPCRLNFGEPRV